jgi:hypothetical protein
MKLSRREHPEGKLRREQRDEEALAGAHGGYFPNAVAPRPDMINVRCERSIGLDKFEYGYVTG